MNREDFTKDITILAEKSYNQGFNDACLCITESLVEAAESLGVDSIPISLLQEMIPLAKDRVLNKASLFER